MQVGAAATAGVLCAGLLAFKQGNSGLSQQMMRARVAFQVSRSVVGTILQFCVCSIH